MRFVRPFSGMIFAVAAVSALAALTPARAQTAQPQIAENAQHAALTDGSKSEAPKSDASQKA
jgi:hypothetical protein